MTPPLCPRTALAIHYLEEAHRLLQPPTPISLTPVSDLLDAARAITGSDAATARRLGVARSAVAKWRAGANALPDGRRRQLDGIIAGVSDAR